MSAATGYCVHILFYFYVLCKLITFIFYNFQRLLRMLDGLNFKEFVAFLSAFSSRASLQQKVECKDSS